MSKQKKILSVEKLCKSFSQNSDVLKDLSFEMLQNECVLILGENGSGKSTFLNCILGLEKVNSGSIKWDLFGNKKLSYPSFLMHQKIAYVSNHIHAYDWMTVFDFLKSQKTLNESPSRNFRDIVMESIKNFSHQGAGSSTQKQINKKETIKKDAFDSILKEFDIVQYKHEYIKNLSTGSHKKVVLIDALISEANVFVFDEPFLGLDQKAKKVLYEKVNQMQNNKNTSFILISHDIEMLLPLIDSCYRLENFKLNQVEVQSLFKNSYDIQMLSNDKSKSNAHKKIQKIHFDNFELYEKFLKDGKINQKDLLSIKKHLK